MSDRPTAAEAARTRRRWISFGETIAVIAVLISAIGLWKSWQRDDKPLTVVQQRQAIPLTLRGKVENDGRSLEISPIEQGHALQSLTVALAGSTIDVGSDGRLSASDVEEALGERADLGKGTHRLRVHIGTDYVEAGANRRASGNYVLAYRWESGGLLGGRSLRLVSFSRA